MPPASAAPDPEPALALAITAARRGDSRAWDTLLARYQLPLFTFVHELVRHEATSLDLVQAAFVRAVQNLATLRDDHRFAGWLFGIAHQLCAQHFRRAGREIALDDEHLALTPDDSAPDPRDLVLRAEQNAAVFALLAELPEPQRAVLVLHVLEDFPLHEIAAITGAPLGTVKSRLHHAKRALRHLLESSSPSTDALAPR
jgi:RNA polymerase sigma-70 factor (ECF subfamily)